MKTTNQLKTFFVSLFLLTGMAQSNTVCSGGACMASFAKSPQSKALPSFKNHKTYAQNESEGSTEEETPEESYLASNQIESVERTSAPVVQVGAFGRLSGAKSYAKRYRLMGDQFITEISRVVRNGKTIYRVRIKGFENSEEAIQFVAMYSNIGAFFVSN